MAVFYILRVSKILSVFAVPFFVFLANTTSLYAQPMVSHGGGGIETETRTTVRPLSTTNNSNNVLFSAQAALVPSDLTHFETFELRGNYTAAGVGLRGRTSGIITLSNIPIGASIHKAYLYWSFLDNGLLVSEQNLVFNGIPVLGTEIGNGGDTCWNKTYSRAFRADITPLITGNGTYVLTGIVNQSPLLAQGASLVVVYADGNGVSRTVIIQDGNGVINNGNIHLATTIDGFIASDTGSGVSAKTTFIVGDGQDFTDTKIFTAGLGTLTLFNTLNGSDGGLWDTDTYDVSSYVASGDTSASIAISRGSDCLNWVAQIFSVTSGTSAPKFSNVLFLPGLEASRLYRPQILQGQDEDQLWEPTRNEDVEQLYLSSTTGESVDPSIYTRDIIDESPQIINGYNIYKSFIAFMNDEMVGEGIINAWKAIPYDWRLDYDDILTSGRKTGDNISYLEATSTPYILQELRQLAETSKTGKVTIIAHSNGGLLAKYLLKKLEVEGNPLLQKIDKLIMVAAPQLGTPGAIEGLLHGDEQQLGVAPSVTDFGLLMDEERARELGENMQSAYNLLPSQKYFDIVQSPVVEFNFPTLYGNTINSITELHNFLLGDPQSDDPRIEPAPNDDESPNVLKPQFLDRAAENHDTVLDSWTPPASMEVIQIAGWGEKTLRGVEYSCGVLTCSSLSTLDRKILRTIDGDGTVVVPSALAVSTSTQNVERYYLNVREYNKEGIFNQRRNREHSDIFEVEPLRDFIKNIIQNTRTLESHITSTIPAIENLQGLDFRLHSPVSLHLYDSEGNHTGRIPNPIPDSDLRAYEARLPNSYYHEYGETKYAGSDTFATTTVKLIGESLGTFTFDIEETIGDTVVASTTWKDIPVTASSTLTLSIQTLASATALDMDVDGDGTIDVVLARGEGVTTQELLAILKGIIKTLNLSEEKEMKLLKGIEKIEKELAKERKNEKDEKQKTKHSFEKIIKTIEKFEKKGVLGHEEAVELFEIVAEIEGSVVK